MQLIISFIQICLIMESEQPPNLANLNQLFNQYDSDHDGRVSDEQIESILKQVGYTDVYIGTIRKIIRLLNTEDPQNKTLTFPQLEEYAEAMTAKGKFKVWKGKCQAKQSIAKAVQELYQNQQNGAAPGASPTGAPGFHSQKQVNSQQGEISVKIGNTNDFSQQISISLQKQKGQQTKPFIRIQVERTTNEQALHLQTSFKSIYDTVIELIKAQEEQLISEIMSVNFDTKVNGNIFILNISTQNQGLIQLAEIYADYMDSILKVPINGKIEGSYKFNFDFQKFVSDPNYSFYDLFVSNCSINLKWNVWDLFHNLRKVLLKIDTFGDLQWSPNQPYCLFLIGLLHCQKFTGRLQFESTPSLNQQLASKSAIIGYINVMKEGIKSVESDSGLSLMQMMQHLDGKFSIEGGLKDWRLKIETRLANFSKLFVQDFQQVEQNESENDSSEQPVNIQALIEPPQGAVSEQNPAQINDSSDSD